jgi:quercetin dioxygenase-like cupin family protein
MIVEPKAEWLQGPSEWYTGSVSYRVIATPKDDAQTVKSSLVRFEHGARAHWHTHSHGQTLLVTNGLCRIQSQGEAAIDAEPGTVVYTPPMEWHWHGASPGHIGEHLAIWDCGDARDGSENTFGAPVTDAQYGAVELN